MSEQRINPNESISGKFGWPEPQVSDVTLLRAKNRSLGTLIDEQASRIAALEAELSRAKPVLDAAREWRRARINFVVNQDPANREPGNTLIVATDRLKEAVDALPPDAKGGG